MTQPATLGRGLGRSFAIATIIAMILYGVVTFGVYYYTELGERCQFAGELEDPPAEILAQVSLAFAFAAPVGILLSVMLGRRLTRETTSRLDDLIDNAQQMTGERLDQRLAVSTHHDPLDRLATAINGVLDRIENGVRAQSQFAADASHELRTPLAVISTNLEVARRKPRDVAHWEHVADGTMAEVRRMHVLVEKLLELARAGSSGLRQERRDLRELATAAVARASTIAADRAIRVELAAGSPVEAEIDPDALAIVLDNLLRNAIDHSQKGEAVSVHVESGPRIVVEDRGPGVPADQRARIFEPFARGVHRDTDRAAGSGLGLGLAICKRIVAGHQGTIAVDDRPGGGARFTITLPTG